MKTYSVKEIADMLNTNPETVRRWIRDGKLVANKSSRKSGNVISESALKSFLQSSPKYRSRADIAVASALMVGGIVAQVLVNAGQTKDANISDNAIIKFAEDKIKEYTDAIEAKKNTIHELEKQVDADKAQVSEYQKLIDNLRISEATENK